MLRSCFGVKLMTSIIPGRASWLGSRRDCLAPCRDDDDGHDDHSRRCVPRPHAPRRRCRTISIPNAMFLLFFAATAAAAVLFLLRIPSVWQSLMALDEAGDMHELGMALVAARTSWFWR